MEPKSFVLNFCEQTASKHVAIEIPHPSVVLRAMAKFQIQEYNKVRSTDQVNMIICHSAGCNLLFPYFMIPEYMIPVIIHFNIT